MIGFRFKYLLQHTIPVLIFLIGFMLNSCTYDPNDRFDNDIPYPVEPVVSLTINQSDSILEIGQLTTCTYEFGSEKTYTIYEISVDIDGVKLPVYHPNTDFSINPADYTYGEHKLTIQVITNTNSGSLADRIGAEGFVFTQEITLFIENRKPDNENPCEIISVTKDSGRLKILWEMYDRINLQRYVLYRLKEVLWDGTEVYEPIIEIKDRSRTFYYDETYVGGQGKYYVTTWAADGFTKSPVFEVNYPLPHIVDKRMDGYNLKVTFTKCLFENNFKQYVLSPFIWEYSYYYCRDTIRDINDTVITINNIVFGSNTIIELATHPVHSYTAAGFSQYEPITKFAASLGDSSFAYYSIASSSPCEYIYYLSDKLYQFSPADDRILKSADYPGDLFHRSSVCISHNGSLLSYNDREVESAMLFTLPDFNTQSVIGNYQHGRTISISNAGLSPRASQNHLIVYDLYNQTPVDTLFTTIYGGFYGALSYISPDGKSIYVDSEHMIDSLYRLIDGKYVATAVSSGLFDMFLAFNPLNPQELVYYADGKIYIKDLSTLALKRMITLDGEPVSNIDPVSGYFLVKDEDPEYDDFICSIYDLNTGLKLFSLNTYSKPQAQEINIYNKVMYSKNGHKLKIVQ